MLLTLYSFTCFFLPGVLWMVAKRKRLRCAGIRHVVWSLILLLYGYLAVHRTAGIGTIWDLLACKRLEGPINWIPLAEGDWLGYGLNIFMFMPLGFLLPLIWEDFRKPGKTVFFGFLLSASIEFFQLFSFRTTDIDDLIMNTLGTAVGFLCWRLLKLLFPRAGSRAVQGATREPYVYLFGGTLGLVLLYNWRFLYP